MDNAQELLELYETVAQPTKPPQNGRALGHRKSAKTECLVHDVRTLMQQRPRRNTPEPIVGQARIFRALTAAGVRLHTHQSDP